MTLLLLFNRPTGGATGTAFSSFVEAGMFLGTWQINDYITFTACIHDDTGAAADADAVPSYAIYEDETAAAIVTGNMAKLGAVDGFYTERVQLTAASGFEAGKCYAIRVQATVGGIVAAAAHVFQVGVAPLTAQQTRDAMKLAPTAGSPAAGSVDAHLDSILAYGAGAGSGTGTYTDTVTDGADPLDNVLVQLSTDAAGTNMVYRTYSAADGTFTLYPDPGTYYVWLELAGYSFTQGAQVVVT